MKNLISLLTLSMALTSTAHAAADLSHDAVITKLVNQKKKVRPQEERTYYFADSNGIAEVANSKDNISVQIFETGKGNDFEYGSLGGDLYGEVKSRRSKLSEGKNEGEILVNLTSYVGKTGAKQLYSQTEMTLSASTNYLHAKVQTTTLREYVSAPDLSADGHYELLKTPKVEEQEVTAPLVLTLTGNDVDAMGRTAARSQRERRATDNGSCTLQSQYIMECSWSLETDYTPDTLHATFSLKNGKISELLDSDIEPGC